MRGKPNSKWPKQKRKIASGKQESASEIPKLLLIIPASPFLTTLHPTPLPCSTWTEPSSVSVLGLPSVFHVLLRLPGTPSFSLPLLHPPRLQDPLRLRSYLRALATPLSSMSQTCPKPPGPTSGHSLHSAL